MFGFFVGTACLVGLIKVMRHGGHYHGGYCAPRWGHAGPRWWPTGARRRGMFRWLFERLDTSPGQEKEILEAVDHLRHGAEHMRKGWRDLRGEVASAVRNHEFQEASFEAIFSNVTAPVETFRKEAAEAFAKIHAVLDERQRKELADLLEAGPFRFGSWGRCGHRNGCLCKGMCEM